MLLRPDPASAHLDPFFAASTLVINCDVLEPATGEPYGRCPRASPSAPRTTWPRPAS